MPRSSGQPPLSPVHDSARSQKPVLARHSVPTARKVQSMAQHEPGAPLSVPRSHCSPSSVVPLPQVWALRWSAKTPPPAVPTKTLRASIGSIATAVVGRTVNPLLTPTQVSAPSRLSSAPSEPAAHTVCASLRSTAMAVIAAPLTCPPAAPLAASQCPPPSTVLKRPALPVPA